MKREVRNVCLSQEIGAREHLAKRREGGFPRERQPVVLGLCRHCLGRGGRITCNCVSCPVGSGNAGASLEGREGWRDGVTWVTR